MLDVKKIEAAINMISAEKKIPKERLIDIIESALKTAYKKDYGSKDENVNVVLNLEEEAIEVSIEKTVVKEVTNPATEISFEDLGDDAENFEEGDTVEFDVTEEVMGEDNGESFGRIASQAARQVIIQKIGETEKERIYDLFNGKEGEVISMKVDMIESGKVMLDYNGNTVVLPKSEQVARDRYTPEQRLYILVAEVTNDENFGPKVVLSRKRDAIVESLFALYVPELTDGTITIDKVVRQPGVKTKMIVSSSFEEIDPVGTLIGQKGMRVKSVMEELNGEKIDIIPNDDDIAEVIKRSLAPAKVISVEVNEEENRAIVKVYASERAKAVGKGGLNVGLASRLTGYTISIEEVADMESTQDDIENEGE